MLTQIGRAEHEGPLFLVVPNDSGDHATALELAAPTALAFEIDHEGTVWALVVAENTLSVPWPQLEWVNLTRGSDLKVAALAPRS